MILLKIHVFITDSIEVKTEEKTVRMISFRGFCDGDFFHGEIQNGGVDTQIMDKNGRGTLSARYMLQGTDMNNKPCRIFIENNASIHDDIGKTVPHIITDSEALKWMETTELVGEIRQENDGLLIIIKETNEKNKMQ